MMFQAQTFEILLIRFADYQEEGSNNPDGSFTL